jgi:hypothetical protein
METRVPLISPCSVEAWDYFLTDATELDATGFPIRGSFGINFNCRTDLSVAPTDAARRALAADNIQSVHAAKGRTLKERQMADAVRQLLLAYTELRPGQTVAFKKGLRIVAFARIVSPYRYEPARTESGGRYPHRWDYVILRKASPSESTPMSGFIQTYYTNKIPYTEEPTPAAAVPAVVPAAAPSLEAVIKAAEAAEKEAKGASIRAQIAHVNAQRVLLEAQLAAL